MSDKFNSFQEGFDRLNGKLYGIAVKVGLSKENAEDVVQDAWLNVYNRMENDADLKRKFETEPLYFDNYLFRTTFNGISNMRNRNTKNNVEPKDEELKTEFADPVSDEQRKERLEKFVSELKTRLKDDENQFFDLFLEVADQNISVNISEVARLMGLTGLKGHDIFKRIKRKAENLEAEKNMLKDVAASVAVFRLGIFDFVRDLFKFEEELDEDLLKAGNRISNKVLNKLGIESIPKLSKIIK